MAMNRHRRFTIYDMMEAKGVFEANPANSDARGPNGEPLYTGPVEFPKMFYHPEGETQVTVPGELVQTVAGPKLLGEQREIINVLANNAAEEKKLRGLGWHDHPAKAVEARGDTPPARSPAEEIADLRRQLAALQAGTKTSTVAPAVAPSKA